MPGPNSSVMSTNVSRPRWKSEPRRLSPYAASTVQNRLKAVPTAVMPMLMKIDRVTWVPSKIWR
ncbi:hypothetical protein D3C74_441640 [compost metagenome]